MYVQERYDYLNAAANSTKAINTKALGGFLCTVSGSLSITATEGGASIVSALPVTAGIFYPIPIVLPSGGISAVLSGGAAGTYFI